VIVSLVVGSAGFAVAFGGPDPEHAFLRATGDGSPFRWNPCEPIHYQVHLFGAPPGADADLDEAIRRITEATGIRFVDDGHTTRSALAQERVEGYDVTHGAYFPVLIMWEPAEDFRRYGDPEEYAGVGIPFLGSAPNGDARPVFASGLIVLNADAGATPGFRGRFSDGPLLMHEWAHVLGLAHVGSARELMWSPDVPGAAEVPDLTMEDWGRGDLEGLRSVGLDAGCIDGL
jgi:hypothetical protein